MHAKQIFAYLAFALLVAASVSAQEQSVKIAGHFYLQRSQDEFGARFHGIIEKGPSSTKFYPLPQSNIETYRKLRSEDLKYMTPHALTAQEYQRQEVIGPYQIEGDHLWFGNHYYDGEGERGVGAFGYFDMRTRKYVLFSPPEVARWEISALLVEPDAIWLALDHFGEDISTSPGGLVRWDRTTHQARHYSLEFVVDRIRRDTKNSSELFLATRGGYALFRNGDVQRFRVEDSSGKEKAVRIRRLPAGPSQY